MEDMGPLERLQWNADSEGEHFIYAELLLVTFLLSIYLHPRVRVARATKPWSSTADRKGATSR